MTTKLDNPKLHVERAVVDKYLAWSGPRPTTTRMGYIADLVKKLPAGADLLELRCGAGVPATQVLIEHDLNVTGNDISAAQITLPRVHSFDAVLGFYSIFHLSKEQTLMIEKTKGWLKPGGWLLCNFHFDEGDFTREGFEGTKDIFRKQIPAFILIVDKVDVEMMGRFDETFHLIVAVKKGVATE
ncbi:S-adenosyl-L-methionine-dependent methyltransferase [Mycena vulgaris]|nr:S-adenosyl-L-methionine-dependent methyltransferase [Mycena vulgaris]